MGDKLLNKSQIRVLAKIRNNLNITKSQLMIKCELGKTSIDKNIKVLKDKHYIKYTTRHPTKQGHCIGF